MVIKHMSKIDHLNLDGNALKTFVTVLEVQSVTRAAEMLGVSQSAVSHTLDKLRQVFDDPLFVRSGRGIMPTARAHALSESIESVLANLNSLTSDREFDPAREILDFTIATNDFPLGFIFPTLIKRLHGEGIHPRLQFIPAGIPSANLLRVSGCQMLITPAPPKRKDIVHEPLVSSKMVCFYDSSFRKPPRTWKQYIESRYVEVRFSSSESSQAVLPSSVTSALGEPEIAVPNFNALPAFIQGSDLITSQIELMSRGPLKSLDWLPLPVEVEPLSLHLVWHQRDSDDPAHRWFRQQIKETIDAVASA